MVAALDLTVAFAHGGVNGLAGVAVEVEREGVFRLAGRAGVSGGLTLVGLQVGSFVDRHKKKIVFEATLYSLHSLHSQSRANSFTESGKIAYRV